MNYRRYLVILTSLCIVSGVWSGCGEEGTNPQPATTGTIQGKVLNGVTGESIEGVSITTDPPTQSVTSTTAGTFTISNVIPTRYTVTASKVGYSSNSVEVQVTAGATTTANITLTDDPNVDALVFDGIDDMVVIPDAANLDLSEGGFTIEFYAWASSFKTRATSGSGDRWNCVIGHGPDNSELDYLIGFEDARPMFYVRSYTSGFVGQTVLETERWYHIAAVHDAVNKKILIYVDGVFDSESSLEGAPVFTAADLFVGAREAFGSGKGAHFFDGILHELRIWNKVRSVSEINATLKTRLQGNEEGLVGYWQFSDGSGVTTADGTNNSNSGTILGGATWTEIESPLR